MKCCDVTADRYAVQVRGLWLASVWPRMPGTGQGIRAQWGGVSAVRESAPQAADRRQQRPNSLVLGRGAPQVPPPTAAGP